MQESKRYELSHHFSEIENLQSEKTLTFSVFDKGGNTIISLKKTTPDKNICTESCLLPDTDLACAENIAIYLCENSFDISTWKDLLEDIGIKYIVTSSNA